MNISRSNRSQLSMVAFIVFVDMLGYGLILPVMPGLIRDITGQDIDAAAKIGGVLLFVYAAMQFLFAALIGALSDRFGRRPVLLVTLFLLGIDYAVMAVAPAISWLVAGRAISGILGATWAAAYASIADCTAPERRGAAYGVLAGAGAAGYVFGPALGGMAGEFGIRLPFVIAAVLAMSGTVVGLFLLKETLPLGRRRKLDLARANPVGTFKRVARTPFILSCLAAIFFMNLAAQAQLSIWPYWGSLQFGWTPLIAGLTASLYGIMLGTAQAFTTGHFVTRFGASQTARYALLLGLPSYLLLAFATSTWVVVLAIVIGAWTGIAFPALQSLMTTWVPDDAQGELQGAIASTISATAIFGPILMTQVFGHFADNLGLRFTGAPFLVGSGILLVAIVILWRALAAQERAKSHPAPGTGSTVSFPPDRQTAGTPSSVAASAQNCSQIP